MKSWSVQPSSRSCPYIQVDQERGAGTMRIAFKLRSSRLEVLHKEYLVCKFWKVFTKALMVRSSFNKIARPVTALK